MFQALVILALLATPTGPSADLSPAEPQCGNPADFVTSDFAMSDLVTTPDPVPMSVFCQANCGTYPDVSCTGNSTCNAVDRNCSNYQRGYVVCDGTNYTYCPVCPECTNGDFRILRTGQCCDYPDAGEERHVQKCINEQWVTQSTGCFPSSKCPIYP